TAQPMLNAAPPDLKLLEVSVMPRTGSPQPQVVGVPNPPGQAVAKQPQSVAAQSAAQRDEQVLNLRNYAQKEINEKNTMSGITLYNQAAAIEQAWDLTNPLAALTNKGKQRAGSDREGPSVTYHLTNRLSVPSRNDEQVLEVTKIDMAPEYFYK